METKISIIIPLSALVPESVKTRVETMQHALRDFYRNVEVIFVEQSLDGMLYFLPYFSGVRKIELRYPVFNKSWCINVGVKKSSHGYVCICDCDMFSRDMNWQGLLNWMVDNKHKWAFAWNRLVYTTPIQRKKILEGQNMPGLSHATPTPGYSEGGMVCVKKEFFYEVGQANECFEDLGGMDNEFIARCRFVTDNYPMFPTLVYHMQHPQRRKSSRPTRRINVKRLRKVQKQTQWAIDWLKKQDMARMVAPLIDRADIIEQEVVV